MDYPSNSNHPIMDVMLMAGLSLVSWVFVTLDHFHLMLVPDLKFIDLLIGLFLKVLAITASVFTILVGRRKLKESKNEKL